MPLCPFHADQAACLQVHLEKNFYHCYACRTTDDVI
ncbi:CHC2 zinc finger domain-containing protein [Myroides sp. LJL115]